MMLHRSVQGRLDFIRCSWNWHPHTLQKCNVLISKQIIQLHNFKEHLSSFELKWNRQKTDKKVWKLDASRTCIHLKNLVISDVSRTIFIPVYRHGRPKNEIYLYLHYYFLSQAMYTYFLHCKPPTDNQHFNMELMCALIWSLSRSLDLQDVEEKVFPTKRYNREI